MQLLFHPEPPTSKYKFSILFIAVSAAMGMLLVIFMLLLSLVMFGYCYWRRRSAFNVQHPREEKVYYKAEKPQTFWEINDVSHELETNNSDHIYDVIPSDSTLSHQILQRDTNERLYDEIAVTSQQANDGQESGSAAVGLCQVNAASMYDAVSSRTLASRPDEGTYSGLSYNFRKGDTTKPDETVQYSPLQPAKVEKPVSPAFPTTSSPVMSHDPTVPEYEEILELPEARRRGDSSARERDLGGVYEFTQCPAYAISSDTMATATVESVPQ